MDIIKQIQAWLEDPVIRCTNSGVCWNLSTAVDIEMWRFRFDEKLLKQLSNYSGSQVFPIGGRDIYWEQKQLGTLWIGEGKRSRYELIDLLKEAEISIENYLVGTIINFKPQIKGTTFQKSSGETYDSNQHHSSSTLYYR